MPTQLTIMFAINTYTKMQSYLGLMNDGTHIGIEGYDKPVGKMEFYYYIENKHKDKFLEMCPYPEPKMKSNN